MNEQELAARVWELARQRIIEELRFMTSSVTRLSLRPTEEDLKLPVCNGEELIYHPRYTLDDFNRSRALPLRRLLHSILHCLLGHIFEKQERQDRLWNTACDLCVEKIVMDLEAETFSLPEDNSRKELLLELEKKCPVMTAVEIYNFFIDEDVNPENMERYENCFTLDDHRLWKRKKRKGRCREGSPELLEDDDTEELEEFRKAFSEEEEQNLQEQKKKRLEKKWKQLSRELEMELKTFNRRYGKRAGCFIDSLAPVNFEECDYDEFLRNFGAQEEVMKLSDDAFDLVYYTFGLRKYGNIPLIEPLEYSDDNRIRNFIIAIDTSGSVQGEIVQSFLQRTCDVLRQTSSFTRQVQIYLIQCDAEVQSIDVITDLDQLQDIIPKLRLKGFGGTDFRPVFNYVEKLKENKKLGKINGLLYFTDGVGTYPEKAPDYKTAFIFNRDDYISPNVPSWAIRAVLTTDSIRVLKDDK